MRVAIFVNLGQPPFTSILNGPVEALRRAAEVTLVEPCLFDGFRGTGAAAPAPIPREAVEAAAESGPFDAVLCLAGGLYVRPEDRELLGERAIRVGIALSDPLGLECSLEIAPEFDLFYTQDPQTVAAYRGQGITVLRCDAAMDTNALPAVTRDEQWDVIFVGKWTPLRAELVSALAPHFKVLVHAHRGEDRWSVPTRPTLTDSESLLRAMAGARLSLEVATVESGPEDFQGTKRITSRPLIAALAGTPSLIEPFPYLADFFEPGKEIVTYRDADDLVSKVGELLADSPCRRQLGDAARHRMLTQHTWARRALMILDDIEQFKSR